MVLVLARDLAIVATVTAFSLMKRVDLRMQPLLVSKLTTLVQVVLVLVTVSSLAFSLEWNVVLTTLVWVTAALTAASWLAYFFEGLRALRTAEARPSA
jgi:cardiolipin synthase